MDEEGLRPELAWGWERHQSPGPQKARGGSCDEPPVPTLHPKLLAAVGQPPPPNAPRREGTPQQGQAQSQEGLAASVMLNSVMGAPVIREQRSRGPG